MIRVGIGYDLHRLAPDRRLILAGVHVPHATGLLGHSDADVLTHAVSDALLGAVAAGDIGQHFPDTDPQYAGVCSLDLLAQVRDTVAGVGGIVQNIDVTVLAQRPKLARHVPAMRANLAETLQLDLSQVSVKATTNEGLDAVGREEAIAAYAVACVLTAVDPSGSGAVARESASTMERSA